MNKGYLEVKSRKRNIFMKKMERTGKLLLLVLITIMTIVASPKIETEAAIADEAFDYEMGEGYSGHVGYNDTKYYKFVVSGKSHVSIEFSDNYESDSSFWGSIKVFDGSKKIIVDSNDFIYQRDAINGVWNTAQYKVLSSGTCPYAMYSDGEYALGQNSLVKNVKIKK